MLDFFAFRRMITPVFIQIIFWVGVIIAILSGIALIVDGVAFLAAFGQDSQTNGSQIFGAPFPSAPPFGFGGAPGGVLIGAGIAQILLGPVFVRVGCELVILFFRIYETLLDIRNNGNQSKANTLLQS